MSGGNSRNGSSTVQLPPLPRYTASRISKGQQPTALQLQISFREWATWFCRIVSSRRTGLYVAALLTCASVLGLVNHLNRLQLRQLQDKHNDFHNEEKRGVLCGKNLTTSSPPLPPRPLPPTSFLDPALPAGHRCQAFTLPPPPADKKRTGPRPCPVCYLPVEDAIKLYPPPGVFPELVVRDLTYVHEDGRARVGGLMGSRFGGHPSLEDRRKSHKIEKSMNLHCGFASGEKPGVGSGFDIDERDLSDMEKCSGVVVTSAIFGNYDPMQQPKNISDHSKKNVCFFMFVDEETEAAITRDKAYLETRKVGLWRVVTIHNLPYADPRRTGKIPKMLSHRLFPNARFSLWIDGKLELTVDPYQILERFLWRSKDTYAISKHYKRFDVFLEAEANKAARKYNNASIDAQVQFYRKEGLRPYTPVKLPLISDVPEGCVIIREHTPVTNLFSCLWFNEVDRFTSRDQISFAIVRDKIMAQVPWRINMFLDCERRNFVVQGYHRDVILQLAALDHAQPAAPSLEEMTKNTTPKKAKRKDGRSRY